MCKLFQTVPPTTDESDRYCGRENFLLAVGLVKVNAE